MTFIADAFDELNSLLQHTNTSNHQFKSFKNLKNINSFASILVRYDESISISIIVINAIWA